MLLAIDVGNTRIKVAVFEKDILIWQDAFDKEDAVDRFSIILIKYTDIKNAVLSRVGFLDESVLKWLERQVNLHVITADSPMPFQNGYETPKTLGIDRMVLASGAVFQFPKQNRLVIDSGTCITYDFIDADDNYLGGAISPGFRLRYEALHNYTAKLPLLTLESPSGVIGNSTKQAIHSGVVNGILYEVEGFIERYREQYQVLTVILTGGDTDFLAKRVKNTIFANPNFLLESLNHLYQYTINK
ncbi:type III pantothenate kinase [Flavobacterium cerinum]|uniref:Type III pantothenate kinase n=1 Tax=Flavobacterium cerinum TaxID=2502784 RepID=A0ABY5ISS9_9FLAO|nr:type III pantothenate kinase [Flavobacterium cerinum]UUC45849.1 type III pantothenate kinase [Flavobacterium cerinum]